MILVSLDTLERVRATKIIGYHIVSEECILIMDPEALNLIIGSPIKRIIYSRLGQPSTLFLTS